MRVLHTSDWHLGRSLETFKRYDEFESFLGWLTQTITDRQVDALVVAGDIFDNTAPPNRAQELYYRFLAGLAGSCCHHVIVVAGNHDSPSFLDAPREILKALSVHVIGAAGENPEDEVVTLKNRRTGKPLAVVCAVPYLRDRDIRSVEAGETIEEKGAKLLQGIREHYARVCAVADELRKNDGDIPLIATGHLFTQGGQVSEDDGVRELYVGTLAHAPTDVFPAAIDYLALGHLHVAQKVGGKNHLRYCGSPLAMGFGEAGQQKQVLLVEFSGRTPAVEEIAVPCCRPLRRLTGSFEQIRSCLKALITENSNAWVEVDYTGDELRPDLQDEVFRLVEGTQINIVRVKNQKLVSGLIEGLAGEAEHDALDEQRVFQKFLEMNGVAEEQWRELRAAYSEILTSLAEEDTNRE